MYNYNPTIICTNYDYEVNKEISSWYHEQIKNNSKEAYILESHNYESIPTELKYLIIPNNFINSVDLNQQLLHLFMNAYQGLEKNGLILLNLLKPSFFSQFNLFKSENHLLNVKGALYQSGFNQIEVFESPNSEIPSRKIPCFLIKAKK